MSNKLWLSLLAAVAVITFLLVQLFVVSDHLDERGEAVNLAVALTVHRELGAAYFEEERYEEALEQLAWVIEQDEATAQDFVNVACVELQRKQGDLEAARRHLEQALALQPELAAAHYCSGLVATRQRRDDAALAHFETTVKLAPEDAPSWYQYGSSLENQQRPEDAFEAYRRIEEMGLEYAGSFYVTAQYRMFRVLLRMSKKDEAQVYMARHRQLDAEGLKAASPEEADRGNLAKVVPPEPEPRTPSGDPVQRVDFEPIQTELVADAGKPAALTTYDLNGDGREDLVIAGANGLFVSVQQSGALFDDSAVSTETFAHLRVADVANHQHASVLAWNADRAVLFSPNRGLEYAPAPLELPGTIHDAAFADYDHDGDLDLVLAAATGLQLVRNDGLEEIEKEDRTTFHHVSWTAVEGEFGFPAGEFGWVAFEDFDADQDVDFLVGGKGQHTTIVSNLRKGRFEKISAEDAGLPPGLEQAPKLHDLNHDGSVDMLLTNDAAVVAVNDGRGNFTQEQPANDLAVLFAKPVLGIADFNLDGNLDVLVQEESRLSLRSGSLLADQSPLANLEIAFEEPDRVQVVDVDGDGDFDLLAPGATGVDVWRNTLSSGQWLRIWLQGRKDNFGAVGTILEIRAGDIYQRRYYRGHVESIGIGNESEVQVVRATWPNGVVQYIAVRKTKTSLEPGVTPPQEPKVHEQLVVLQKEGAIGSCPFLYTFNGEQYEFISDLLGITPLGLPMAEGHYVPPDHDELIRIEDEQLQPADGEYRLAITEELREVTYLDRVQLWVVDHDHDVQVHPEERFCFPPFPPQKIHTVRNPLPLVQAVDQNGEDHTRALAELDGSHAVPFEPLPSQFLGLATPHTLEMTLPEQARNAETVRLVMTGWLYWTDASVNMAASRHSQYEFVPPILSVPESSGGWRDRGSIGFPAGKTKTMIVDVSEMLNRDDLRIRLFSTLRLYWDRIEIAVDAGDAEFQVTRLEPIRADLFYRGFSEPTFDVREDQPELFDYARLTEHPRWNQHQGWLTRFGDVLALLGDIDDKFVIFSAGDAIDLRFDATRVKPRQDGARRTYLLFADGWAKDADHNTAFAGVVEPLPFHGMSGYPYQENESYPADPEHRQYRQQWNTRPGAILIERLANPAGTKDRAPSPE